MEIAAPAKLAVSSKMVSATPGTESAQWLDIGPRVKEDGANAEAAMLTEKIMWADTI